MVKLKNKRIMKTKALLISAILMTSVLSLSAQRYTEQSFSRRGGNYGSWAYNGSSANYTGSQAGYTGDGTFFINNGSWNFNGNKFNGYYHGAADVTTFGNDNAQPNSTSEGLNQVYRNIDVRRGANPAAVARRSTPRHEAQGSRQRYLNSEVGIMKSSGNGGGGYGGGSDQFSTVNRRYASNSSSETDLSSFVSSITEVFSSEPASEATTTADGPSAQSRVRDNPGADPAPVGDAILPLLLLILPLVVIKYTRLGK